MISQGQGIDGLATKITRGEIREFCEHTEIQIDVINENIRIMMILVDEFSGRENFAEPSNFEHKPNEIGVAIPLNYSVLSHLQKQYSSIKEISEKLNKVSEKLKELLG